MKKFFKKYIARNFFTLSLFLLLDIAGTPVILETEVNSELHSHGGIYSGIINYAGISYLIKIAPLGQNKDGNDHEKTYSLCW